MRQLRRRSTGAQKARTAFSPGLSEYELGNDRALPRQRDSGSGNRPDRRADPAEARRRLTLRVTRLRRLSIRHSSSRRIVISGAIENVGELRADIQRDSLVDTEYPSRRHILHGTAHIPVIVVIGSRSAELTSGRGGPCGRIQNERRVGIVAMAVDV